MSATLDPNPIPRHAVSMWADERNAFMAIPMKGKAPFITRFPLTSVGLGEALAKMRNYHTRSAGPPIYTPPPREVPIVRGPMSSDSRMALAQSILKRLMITPKV